MDLYWVNHQASFSDIPESKTRDENFLEILVDERIRSIRRQFPIFHGPSKRQKRPSVDQDGRTAVIMGRGGPHPICICKNKNHFRARQWNARSY